MDFAFRRTGAENRSAVFGGAVHWKQTRGATAANRLLPWRAPAVVEKARPILEPISSAILHIGRLGTASSLKLAMDMNIASIAKPYARA
jgi:3-hydroxyisobutyrate dehydrogenase-like beta-hydroxyacid dehydrogenase